jgi:tetratricopeptide (TPR) repeat protein
MQDPAVDAQIAELIGLARQAYDAGRLADCEEILVGLRTVTRTNLEVNTQLGVLLASQGRFQAARPPLEDAIRLDPGDAVLLFVLSACDFAAEDYDAALSHADASLALDPASPDAHGNRGNALLRLGRREDALEALRAAQTLGPRDPAMAVNVANVLTELDRHAEALESLDRALALAPQLAAAHLNRANVLTRLGRHAEALAAYDQAIALDPNSVDAHCNRGICRLLLGDHAGGWADYEWRWRRDVADFRPRGFAQPLWLGREAIAGRTLLLHAEQGLGDTLQFVRYVADVAARGARVVLEVQPPLVRLVRGLPGVAQVVTRGDALPAFDLHCPLMSLPLALGEAQPAPDRAPYLTVPDAELAAWSERLGRKTAPRIGLVVSGRAAHGNDAQRSLSFAALTPYLPAGLDYHLLQKEVREADRDALAARPDVRVWAEALGDFADTAALTRLMDLVVSVDTSVAHLAGAIGRPAALLLPAEPDWRWGLNAPHTPWYASLRLYRQTRQGDWQAPLAQVAAELRALIGA